MDSQCYVSQKFQQKWSICIDYINLNKATPKDYYPLPTIVQVIDATTGHVLYSFHGVFSSYNQITLAPEDRSKIAFITQGLYMHIGC